MMSRAMFLGLTIAIATFTGGADAHDVTIYPIQNGERVSLEMYLGDPGDYQPIERVRFVDLLAFNSSGVKIRFTRDVQVAASGNREAVTPALRLGDNPDGTYVIAGRYDNGFYVHDEENRAVATTKEWFPDAIDSAHYMKFSKCLFHIGASSGGYDRVIGHRLELIPRADPFALQTGAMLPVELRFDGNIIANHIVEIGDETSSSIGKVARTNADGIVLVPLNHKGFYRLAVDQRAPSKYPALYSYDDYTASLVFKR